jgi:hypothetical protein
MSPQLSETLAEYRWLQIITNLSIKLNNQLNCYIIKRKAYKPLERCVPMISLSDSPNRALFSFGL